MSGYAIGLAGVGEMGFGPLEQGTPVQAMPVAMAVFFATRLSFAPVLRMTPFADLLKTWIFCA
jgi:hypothetical protein